MREVMDFDPKPHQREVDEYLATYDVRLLSKIEVEWCSLEIDVIMSPHTDNVYFHTQILALGLKLPMTFFVRDVLAHFKVPPSQHQGHDELSGI